MKYFIALIVLIFNFANMPAIAQETTANKTSPGEDEQSAAAFGTYSGNKDSKHPAWFKESFLDFTEDIEEAAAEGKRLALYFYQDGCPYCNQLWEHNMAVDGIEAAFKSKFDVVAINMWGDKEVVTVGGKPFTEKALARALDVDFTPTLQFYNEQKKPVLRLNGYLPPKRFKLALSYASGEQGAGQSFNEFVSSKASSENALARTEPFYQRADKALGNRRAQPASRPLAVMFETPDCAACERFHDITLQHPDTRAALAAMDVVQLNAQSDVMVSKPDGKQISAKQWAAELDLAYFPSIVFFDEKGEQVMLMNAYFRNFHSQSIFIYVTEKAYLQEPSFQRYISARADRFIEQGIDVDIWEE